MEDQIKSKEVYYHNCVGFVTRDVLDWEEIRTRPGMEDRKKTAHPAMLKTAQRVLEAPPLITPWGLGAALARLKGRY